MTRAAFLEKIRNGILLCDGAMGTQLLARGLTPGECSERWCLEHPDRVAAIHRDYRGAGVDMVTTNTFGATRTMLARHGLEGRVREINIAGAKAARQGAGAGAIVLGDVGPFGDFLEPVGDVTAAQLAEIFAEQIEALREGGADGIIIETMGDVAEAAVAARVARRTADWPVLATFAFARIADGSFRTMSGATVLQVVEGLRAAGADAVGANCGTSLTLPDYADLAKQLVAAAGKAGAAGGIAVVLQPNAGSPGAGEWKPVGADEMAKLAAGFREAGVRIIGGCCGTTPAHLAAMAHRLGKTPGGAA
jgi:5-methyltetrahydrofolate--homocysteine methyltransferase